MEIVRLKRSLLFPTLGREYERYMRMAYIVRAQVENVGVLDTKPGGARVPEWLLQDKGTAGSVRVTARSSKGGTHSVGVRFVDAPATSAGGRDLGFRLEKMENSG